MEKTKLSLSTVLNFICIFLFTTIVICYLSAFFKFSGQVASIHDLVGFPAKNTALQEYIISKIDNEAYLATKSTLNFNAFVYAPILIIITSFVGILVNALKLKSENLWWYKIAYGLIGIVSFAAVDILRLGNSWKFQVVIFSIVLLIGIAEVIIKFLLKKEIEFDADVDKIKTTLVSVFGVIALISIVLFTTSNLKVKQQAYTIEHPETIEVDEHEVTDKDNTEEDDTSVLVSELIKGTPVNDIIEKIENDEIKLNNKDEILEELKASDKGEEGTTTGEKVIKFKEYTVKEGDILITICENEGINYSERVNLIVAVNNLTSPSSISTGQVLLLPVEE